VRQAVFLLALAACGRVGFDASAMGDASAGGDGAMMDGMLVQDDCTEPGLLLYLAFDETSGTLARDSSGNNHDGTLVDFNLDAWTTGHKGGALRFDGIDDRVVLRSPGALADIHPLTACAWITIEGIPDSFGTIVDKSLDGYSEGWNFYVRDTAALGMFVHTESYIEGGDLAMNAWKHVCGTWDGTPSSPGIGLFVGGDSVSADLTRVGTAIASDAAHVLTIGRSSSGRFPFQGTIDELRIYDHAITAPIANALMMCSSM
jgi:hypothetical protein